MGKTKPKLRAIRFFLGLQNCFWDMEWQINFYVSPKNLFNICSQMYFTDFVVTSSELPIFLVP